VTLPEHPPLGRRGRTALISIAVTLGLLLVVGWVVAIWTDWLWFDEVGFTSVYSRELSTRFGLFLAASLGVGMFLFANLALAVRLRPFALPLSPEPSPSELMLDRVRFAVGPRLGRWLGIPAIAVAFLFGLAAQGQWRTWLLFRNAQPFGVKDPQFNTDIGYYVFRLPFWQYLLGVGFAVVTLALLGALMVHVIFGAVRLTGPGDRITPGARAHLTSLIAAYVGLKAIAYELDKRALVLDHNSTYDFNGAGYTDVHALASAKEILAYLAVIVALAILVFSNAFLRNIVWPGVALAMLAISAISIGGVYPWAVQTFKVKPTPTLETPYAQRAIDATLRAYGMAGTSTQNYQSTNGTPPASMGSDKAIVQNIRLLDPAIVAETYTQLQQVRSFYDFGKKLDVDRYTVDGQTSDYLVGLRGINYDKLSDAQRNWQNTHTVYTHGYGMVAAPAGRLGCPGQPYFVSGFLGTTAAPAGCSSGTDLLGVEQPRVYYGEGFSEYAVVGSDGTNVEYDRPAGETGAQYSTYNGKGGVPLNSAWKRTLYALSYMETNFLLSEAVHDNSKILYVRDPRERVQKVAPFLTLDGDPYPAVVDGRILWIVDGYTTATHYPYAQRVDLRDATSDALTGSGTVAQARQEITYMRNSVKATVDAYDGTVTLYEFDDEDPVLRAWNRAFGGIVKPKSAIPTSLAAHFRYPEDMFKVQRDLLTRYHVTNAGDFTAGPDFWKVPDDPAQTTGVRGKQPPYYLYTQLPGQQQTQFQLVAALTPTGDRQNLASLISGTYVDGKPQLRILELPKDTQVAGPNQAQQVMENKEAPRTDINIWKDNVLRGNLLSLPYGEGMLYVEPLYVRSSGEKTYPQLRKILVAYGDRVGYADSLPDAIAQLTGAASPAIPTGPSSGSTSPEVAAAVARIQKALADLKAAQQKGDWVAQGHAFEDLEKAIQDFDKASAASPATSASPSPSASASTP
jgi:uncharacterized protein